VEALNVFNHANFANPGADISNAVTFGSISSPTGSAQERTIRSGRVGVTTIGTEQDVDSAMDARM
jgi:hypothetical protein